MPLPVVARRRNRHRLATFDRIALVLSFAVGVLALRAGLGSGTVQRGHLGPWVLFYMAVYLGAFGLYGVHHQGLVGSGVVADSVASRLATVEDIELLGYVDDPGGFSDAGRGGAGIGRLGSVAALPSLCDGLDADRVLVAFGPTAEPALADTLRQLPPDVQISVVPRLFDLLTWRSEVDELHGLPMMDVAPPVLSTAGRVTKRAVDLTISSGLLVLGLPLWLTIAVAIKVTSPGPVLSLQERRGRGSRPFQICKFRTMRSGAEQEKDGLPSSNDVDGALSKIKDDPRMTWVGRILRATSLDETPAADQRAEGRDEPGRPHAVRQRRGRSNRRVGHPPIRRTTRDDRPVAGFRPQRPPVRGAAPPRLRLRRFMVPVVGPEDHLADARLRAAPTRRALTCATSSITPAAVRTDATPGRSSGPARGPRAGWARSAPSPAGRG
jgi:hypothetical protein